MPSTGVIDGGALPRGAPTGECLSSLRLIRLVTTRTAEHPEEKGEDTNANETYESGKDKICWPRPLRPRVRPAAASGAYQSSRSKPNSPSPYYPDLFASGTQTLIRQTLYRVLGLTSVLQAASSTWRPGPRSHAIAPSFSRVTAATLRGTEQKEKR